MRSRGRWENWIYSGDTEMYLPTEVEGVIGNRIQGKDCKARLNVCQMSQALCQIRYNYHFKAL